MSDDAKAIVRRLTAEVFDKGDVAVVDELVAPDFVDHTAPPGTPPGPDGVRFVASMFQAAFSGWETEIHGMIAEGDTVAFWGTGSGIHSGTFMGIPATGKRISIPGMHIVKVRNGRVAEHWSYNDQMGTMRQLGIVPGH
jgi:steroid delta-isomerase-like uncharacterized protein